MKKTQKTQFLSFFLTLVLALSLFPSTALATEAMSINADVALLVDLDHDEILYDQKADEACYPASITKVMTALLTLEAIQRGELSLDTVVTVSDAAMEGLSEYGSTQNLKPGEQMSVENLLYCLLVASANEAANILAIEVSGSIDAFVQQMNDRAAELGCTGTHYANTHGLHDDDHYTTAHDIYRIVRKAMEFSTFCTIVATDEYFVPATNLADQRHFYNTNLLLSAKKIPGYVYSGCIGVKTGTTDEAGHCLVAVAERDGKQMLTVIMGAENVTDADGTLHRLVYSETARLLDYGFDCFTYTNVLTAGDVLYDLPVTLSEETDHVILTPAQDLSVSLPVDADPDAFQRDIVPVSDSVEAPVTAGQMLGTVTVSYQGKELGTVDLIAATDVALSSGMKRQQQVQTFFSHWYVKAAIVVVLVLAAALILKATLLRGRGRYGSHRYGGSRSYRGRRRR